MDDYLTLLPIAGGFQISTFCSISPSAIIPACQWIPFFISIIHFESELRHPRHLYPHQVNFLSTIFICHSFFVLPAASSFSVPPHPATFFLLLYWWGVFGVLFHQPSINILEFSARKSFQTTAQSYCMPPMDRQTGNNMMEFPNYPETCGYPFPFPLPG